MINLINKYWGKNFTFEAKIFITEILWLTAGKKNTKNGRESAMSSFRLMVFDSGFRRIC